MGIIDFLVHLSTWIWLLFEGPGKIDMGYEVPLRHETPEQAKHRSLFAEAVKYAKERIKDPEMKRFFKSRAKPGRTAFTTAVSMYMRYHNGNSGVKSWNLEKREADTQVSKIYQE